MSRISKPERLELWRNRLNRFSLRNQTVAEFCSTEGISVPSFYQWKRRLSPAATKPKRSRKPKLKTTTAFAELKMGSALPSIASVQLPGGVRIELGTEPATVAKIVEQVLKHSLDVARRDEATSC